MRLRSLTATAVWGSWAVQVHVHEDKGSWENAHRAGWRVDEGREHRALARRRHVAGRHVCQAPDPASVAADMPSQGLGRAPGAA